MENKSTSFTTIDEYILSCPREYRPKLLDLRAVIKEVAPDAREKISYRMPAFEQNGILVYFALHTNHIGFYPTSSGISAFKGELAGYVTSKGAVQFPLDKPLPLELISRMVKFRLMENMKRTGRKK